MMALKAREKAYVGARIGELHMNESGGTRAAKERKVDGYTPDILVSTHQGLKKFLDRHGWKGPGTIMGVLPPEGREYVVSVRARAVSKDDRAVGIECAAESATNLHLWRGHQGVGDSSERA